MTISFMLPQRGLNLGQGPHARDNRTALGAIKNFRPSPGLLCQFLLRQTSRLAPRNDRPRNSRMPQNPARPVTTARIR
jgi:hypothetical protein